LTYRSEHSAFEAEARQLASELELVEQEAQRLMRGIERRSALRNARRVRLLLVIALVGAGIFATSRFFVRRNAAADRAANVQQAESEIAALQAELERYQRSRRIAKAFEPLAGVMRRLDVTENEVLFPAIRDADPTQADDAWWIVALGTCGVPYVAATRAEALEHLSADRRERARKLCP
jgi:hypothetical protein